MMRSLQKLMPTTYRVSQTRHLSLRRTLTTGAKSQLSWPRSVLSSWEALNQITTFELLTATLESWTAMPWTRVSLPPSMTTKCASKKTIIVH